MFPSVLRAGRLTACLLALCSAPFCAAALTPVEPTALPQSGDANLATRLASYAGRPVLVNFWASWCEPCREEMPALQALADSGVVVLTIAVADRDADARRFLDQAGVALPLLFDREQRISKAWGVRLLPYTVVLDRRHRVVARAQGVVDWDASAVREQLQRLMR
ncbi:MAG: TlpA family protein disulfide reductase [Thauera sp.]|nr:MAG: TlpA family protein disulfide reductase [Thauera sp.]